MSDDEPDTSVGGHDTLSASLGILGLGGFVVAATPRHALINSVTRANMFPLLRQKKHVHVVRTAHETGMKFDAQFLQKTKGD